jgi:hypothetical protein
MKVFLKNINNNSKIIPFKSNLPDIGQTKYLPSFSKEWKNIIYSYNKKKMQNLPVNDLSINKVIRSYFNLYFKDYKFVGSKKFILLNRRRNFLRNIHVSNAEIKHTNNKAIITLYTVNREKRILKDKYLELNNEVSTTLIQRYLLLYRQNISKIYDMLNIDNNVNQYRNLLVNDLVRKTKFVNYKLDYLKKFLKLKHLYTKKIWSVLISKYSKRYLRLIRKYDLMYSLNEYKFNNLGLLPLLTNFLTKITGKKIEYNIINLKSIIYNTDLFTNALSLKLNTQRIDLQRSIFKMLKKVNMPITSLIRERTFLPEERALDFIKNNYRDLKIVSNMSDNNINKLLNNVHSKGSSSEMNYNSKRKVHNKIFTSIRYKNLGGIRLEINGRLSKRYRADRALHVLKWKGALKNIDSSFKRLSSVLFRGNTKSNVSYSVTKSTRRIGAFAVKGWISGK